MTQNAIKLVQNAAWCEKLSRQMGREIQARLDAPYTDTNRVACAAERIAEAANYASVARMLEVLPLLDASTWLSMMMVDLNQASLQEDMRVATGRTAEEWLALSRLR